MPWHVHGEVSIGSLPSNSDCHSAFDALTTNHILIVNVSIDLLQMAPTSASSVMSEHLSGWRPAGRKPGWSVGATSAFMCLAAVVTVIVVGVLVATYSELSASSQVPNGWNAMPIIVVSVDQETVVLVSATASATTITNAVSAAINAPVSHKGESITLVDSHGKSLSRFGRNSLRAGGRYTVKRLDLPLPVPTQQSPLQRKDCSSVDSKLPRSRSTARVLDPDHDVVRGGLPGRLPRVAVVTMATGDERTEGIVALYSAYKRFGGDCIVSLHLLTDDLAGVAGVFNPVAVHAHAQTMAGKRLAYTNLLHILDSQAFVGVDHMVVIHPTVRFEANVSVQDMAGDLFAVEHAFYPRDHAGFCQPHEPDGRVRGVHGQVCEYPYIRSNLSAAHVPMSIGKFWRKGKKKLPNGHNMVFMVTTSTYYQDMIWGGRPKYVRELIADVLAAQEKDTLRGLVNWTMEMYFNTALHRASARKDLNIRRLSSSFGYPVVDTPGNWTHELETNMIGIHGKMQCGTATCERARPNH